MDVWELRKLGHTVKIPIIVPEDRVSGGMGGLRPRGETDVLV